MNNIIEFKGLDKDSGLLEVYQATYFNLLLLRNDEEDRDRLSTLELLLAEYENAFPEACGGIA